MHWWWLFYQLTKTKMFYTIQNIAFGLKLDSSWLVVSSDTDQSKSFEDQVEKRPLPSPPTTGKLGPHAWKSLVSNVLNILSSSSSPLTSLPSPSPSYLSSWSQRSVFYRLLRRDQFQPAQHFHITRLYFGADLRDWQTLIRDFEIGVTRCQTSESDSFAQ